MIRTLMSLVTFFCVVSLYAQNPAGLKVGASAKDFTGTDQNKQRVNLYEQLEKTPVVLIFYRGEWCPHCDKHLSALQDSIQLILEKGASVIAVSPELPEYIEEMAEKTGASFSLIHDEGYEIMKAYDVAFVVDDKTVQRYKKWDIHLDKAHGNDLNTLPVPATYIIGQDKKISFVHFDPDYKYKNRATVKSILNHLNNF